MFQALLKILKNKDVMKKIGFTLLAYLIFKIMTYVTVPLVDPSVIAGSFTNSGFLGIVNSISGNAMKHYSIVALGITPYITASIITQILQMDIIPALKEWSEEGETGKKKIQRLNRYLAIGLAFVQALAMTFAFHSSQDRLFLPFVTDFANGPNMERNLWFLVYFYIAIVLTAGTAFMIWLADQITLRGFGNGSSMIIVGGIIMALPGTITSIYQFYIADPSSALGTAATAHFANIGAWSGYALFGVSILMFIIVLVGVTYMTVAVRKVPIQYANRPASQKFQGKTDSNVPIKVNTAGVIPVVFASIILSLPNTIFKYVNIGASAKNWITQVLSYNQPIGFVVYVILIFTFTFFYSFIIVKPEQIAENLHKQNAYIPGVRPGAETEAYITRILFRVTVIGALFLIVIASLPIITSIILGQSYLRIGGTSLLIIVGVSIQTIKQVQTDTQEKTYAGFMR